MRIDTLLPALCLFKTRSQASRACTEGRVWLNGVTVRPSHVVRAGDRIRWRDALGRFEEEVEILEVPVRRVSRDAAREMIRRIESRRIENLWD